MVHCFSSWFLPLLLVHIGSFLITLNKHQWLFCIQALIINPTKLYISLCKCFEFVVFSHWQTVLFWALLNAHNQLFPIYKNFIPFLPNIEPYLSSPSFSCLLSFHSSCTYSWRMAWEQVHCMGTNVIRVRLCLLHGNKWDSFRFCVLDGEFLWNVIVLNNTMKTMHSEVFKQILFVSLHKLRFLWKFMYVTNVHLKKYWL